MAGNSIENKYQTILNDAMSVALVRAISAKVDGDVIEMMLDKNPKIDMYTRKDNHRPLLPETIEHPEAERILCLLQKHSEKNDIVNVIKENINLNGDTILHHACKYLWQAKDFDKATSIIKTILELGADISKKNNEKTIPFWLLIRSYGLQQEPQIASLITLIAEKYTEILDYNVNGNNFFDYVIEQKDTTQVLSAEAFSMVIIALENGVDPTVKNKKDTAFVDVYKNIFSDKPIETLTKLIDEIIKKKKYKFLEKTDSNYSFSI